MTARVLCESVAPGLLAFERTVAIQSRHGQNEFVRVADDALVEKDGRQYLEVGVVNRNGDAVLIEFPNEADSGANRAWVPLQAVTFDATVRR